MINDVISMLKVYSELYKTFGRQICTFVATRYFDVI